jgi:DNA-binding MarR family transcriptional regulator
MDKNEIKTLRMLEAFEENPFQTQRDLSKNLKISLGMVNAFTKRLAKKGFFKVKTIPRGRVQYILTPNGIAEKTRLTYQYILYSIQYYKSMREKLKNIFNTLSNQEKKRVFFYGVSELAEIAYITLQETDIKLIGVIDDNMLGQKFMGLRIEGTDRLKTTSINEVVIITRMDCSIIDLKRLTNSNILLQELLICEKKSIF